MGTVLGMQVLRVKHMETVNSLSQRVVQMSNDLIS